MAARLLAASPTLRSTEREWRFFMLTWRGVVFTNFIAPILLLVALGVGLGGLVSNDASVGDDYLAFITPGLLVGAVVQNAAGLSLWPIMAGHRWLGFHRAMVSTPLTSNNVIDGYLLWLGIRSMATGAVFLAAGAALGGISSPWALLAIPVAALAALGFAAPLSAYTAAVDSDLAFDPIMRLVIAPLYLFSGTLFPSSELPRAVELIAQLFPLWHGVEFARAATSGTLSWGSALLNLAVIGLWLTVGIVLAHRTFARRLAP